MNQYQGPNQSLRGTLNRQLVKTLINKTQKLAKSQILAQTDDLEYSSWAFVDIIDFLVIAQALSTGNDHKAYRMIHSLDTGAREELPATVWNKFDY